MFELKQRVRRRCIGDTGTIIDIEGGSDYAFCYLVKLKLFNVWVFEKDLETV